MQSITLCPDGACIRINSTPELQHSLVPEAPQTSAWQILQEQADARESAFKAKESALLVSGETVVREKETALAALKVLAT